MLRDADEDDPLSEDEGPDDDAEDRDSADIAPCPQCGRMILEDSPRCPRCGAWLMRSDWSRAGRRRWLWPVVAVLIFVILYLWHGFRPF